MGTTLNRASDERPTERCFFSERRNDFSAPVDDEDEMLTPDCRLSI